MVSRQSPETQLNQTAGAATRQIISNNSTSEFQRSNESRKGMSDSKSEGVTKCPQQGAGALTVAEIDRQLQTNGDRQREVQKERDRLLKEKEEQVVHINNLQGFSQHDNVGDGDLRVARIAEAKKKREEIRGKIHKLDSEMHGLKSKEIALEKAKKARIDEAELARREAEKAMQAEQRKEAERSERLRKGFPEKPQFSEDQVEESTMHYNVPGLVPRPSRS